MGSHHPREPPSTRFSPLNETAARIPLRGTAGCERRGPPGQPVIALAMLLAAWTAVRMTFIALDPESARAEPALAALSSQASVQRPGQRMGSPSGAGSGSGADDLRIALRAGPVSTPEGHATAIAALAGARSWFAVTAADFVEPAGSLPSLPRAVEPNRHASGMRLDRWDGGASDLGLALQGSARDSAVPGAAPAGHNLAFPRYAYRLDEALTDSRAAPAPAPGAVHVLDPASAPASASAKSAPRKPRWSADGWVLVRGGDSAPALAAGGASYGASQAGAVLRYALAPSSALRPQAYARVSAALGGTSHETETALGLMARPLRRLPLAILGEVRLQNQRGALQARPVVMAVTELAPFRGPLGFDAEAYGQAGWAGGQDATLFYDFAATFQRRVAKPLSGVDLRAGGGVWSGGQRGAARLDLGPRFELRTMIGPPSRRIGVRVGVDWRFRVAGHAEPGSGPALTVAAGF